MCSRISIVFGHEACHKSILKIFKKIVNRLGFPFANFHNQKKKMGFSWNLKILTVQTRLCLCMESRTTHLYFVLCMLKLLCIPNHVRLLFFKKLMFKKINRKSITVNYAQKPTQKNMARGSLQGFCDKYLNY